MKINKQKLIDEFTDMVDKLEDMLAISKFKYDVRTEIKLYSNATERTTINCHDINLYHDNLKQINFVFKIMHDYEQRYHGVYGGCLSLQLVAPNRTCVYVIIDGPVLKIHTVPTSHRPIEINLASPDADTQLRSIVDRLANSPKSSMDDLKSIVGKAKSIVDKTLALKSGAEI